jgi:hypothetical protein
MGVKLGSQNSVASKQELKPAMKRECADEPHGDDFAPEAPDPSLRAQPLPQGCA